MPQELHIIVNDLANYLHNKHYLVIFHLVQMDIDWAWYWCLKVLKGQSGINTKGLSRKFLWKNVNCFGYNIVFADLDQPALHEVVTFTGWLLSLFVVCVNKMIKALIYAYNIIENNWPSVWNEKCWKQPFVKSKRRTFPASLWGGSSG